MTPARRTTHERHACGRRTARSGRERQQRQRVAAFDWELRRPWKRARDLWPSSVGCKDGDDRKSNTGGGGGSSFSSSFRIHDRLLLSQMATTQKQPDAVGGGASNRTGSTTTTLLEKQCRADRLLCGPSLVRRLAPAEWCRPLVAADAAATTNDNSREQILMAPWKCTRRTRVADFDSGGGQKGGRTSSGCQRQHTQVDLS